MNSKKPLAEMNCFLLAEFQTNSNEQERQRVRSETVQTYGGSEGSGPLLVNTLEAER